MQVAGIAAGGDRDDREIRQRIRAGVNVVRIVQRNAVTAQIDAESRVGINSVPKNRRRVGGRSNLNPRAAVEGDDVAGSGRGSADDVAGRRNENADRIAGPCRAGVVSADPVGLDGVAAEPAECNSGAGKV